MLETVANSEHIGISQDGYFRAEELLNRAVSDGQVMGAALQVARHAKALPVMCAGSRRINDSQAVVDEDTIFLIASITKPIVCATVMKLIEDGVVCLDDLAQTYLPEFGTKGKERITLRHLLTHTSGLPDMLPDNQTLRKAHQPLSVFVEKMCALELLFEPGTQISYQSCGIAILSAIVEQVVGESMPDILRTWFFDPLGLQNSSLGRQDDLQDQISELVIPGSSDGGAGGTDWDWNSDYWQKFGAPWGGMFTTAGELTVLCQTFLQGGTWLEKQILGRSTIDAMTRNQTQGMDTLPTSEKDRQRWGLGWRLSDAGTSGDLISPRTFGHSGATGTVAWMDPMSGVSFVLLTNQADGAKALRPRLSNVIAGSVR